MGDNNASTPKSKKPANTAFKQQRLKAWQPILTPKTVLPTFFIVALLFIPLGAVLYSTSQGVKEVMVEYTNCTKVQDDYAYNSPADLKFTADGNCNKGPCNCTVTFQVKENITAPYYIYYRLTKFYQNHRRYVKSLSSDQLRGVAVDNKSDLKGDCDPIAFDSNNVTIYPCGLIANSLFNDTFSSITSSNTNEIVFNQTGIAWPSDAKKFRKTNYDITKVVAPPNWAKYYENGKDGTYPSQEELEKVVSDESFQVWMRTAGLPNFRKLYGRYEGDVDLVVGTEYNITILNQYPVEVYGGTKSFVISQVSWLGGRNDFLGIAYMTVGSICFALAVIFLVRHMMKPRKLGDHSYLSWNKQH